MNNADKLVERVVTGNKSYNWLNHELKDAKHELVPPGTSVKVTVREANAFPHCLMSPTVAAANKAAVDALREANEAEEAARMEALAETRAATPKVTEKADEPAPAATPSAKSK